MATVNLDALRRFGSKSTLDQQGRQEGNSNRQSSFGNPVTNSFFGINYMQTPLPVPMNKDHYGHIFFTRPQLNLQTANLEKDPRFSDYLTTEELSIHRAIRCYLDPRLQRYDNVIDAQGNPMGLKCPLVDEFNAFIPLLSNHAIASSGFQDKISPIYRSPEGMQREVHSMVDGITDIYGSWSLPVTFRNSKNDPITKLFDLWVDYPALVFNGTLSKYLDYVLGGLLDYQTRIYRLTLDPNKRYVTGIAATGVAFPTNVPKGQQYDFNIDKPYNDANNQITIQFECNGAFYEDFRLVHDFNAVVAAFHQDMESKESRSRFMKKVTPAAMTYFNCRAYPHIDPDTKELEWFVGAQYFDEIYKEASDIMNFMLDRSTEVFINDDGSMYTA